MNKYILRFLLMGQLLIVAMIALTLTPLEGYSYIEAILQSIGILAAIDVAGLTVAYFIRKMDEHLTVTEFIKDVW